MGAKLELACLLALFHLFIIVNAKPFPEPPSNTPQQAPATTPGGGGTEFDITKLGAKPGGDATKGFMEAMKGACESTSPSTVLVPEGNYSLGPVKLEGPCKSPITFNILGNFRAPPDASAFGGADAWVWFCNVDGITIKGAPGGGVFDGQGEATWNKHQCDNDPKCHTLPYNFKFDIVSNSEVSGISSMNSKSFHMGVVGGKQFSLHDITISASGCSPNTDGIHIARVDTVNVTNSFIGTGDDCISIGDGTKNLNVQNVTCDPGHGISVGSLGLYQNEEPVTGVTIKGCTIRNTLNGVRIKTWFDSFDNEVSGIHFEDITIQNVSFPIVIDQEYCPFEKCKSKAPSKVKISDVKFLNVKGTSGMKNAVQLICSGAFPCEKIELADIDLTYDGKDGPGALSLCKNVKPAIIGKQNPPVCAAPITGPTPSTDL